jgi:hypothetical protein
VWACALLLWTLTKSDIRRSLVAVVRSALRWKLLLGVVVAALYTCGVVSVLSWAGLWTPDLIKDTVLWFLFAGLAMASSGVLAPGAEAQWRTILKEQVAVIVAVEYLATAHTFTLWVELLMLPILSIVVLTNVVASHDDKHAAVARLTKGMMVLAGLCVLAASVYLAWNARVTFDAVSVARELALAPLLSAAFMPLMFSFALFSAYEQLFLMLRLGPSKDAGAQRSARLRLVRRLGLRPSVVRAFHRAHGRGLREAATRAELEAVISQRRLAAD